LAVALLLGLAAVICASIVIIWSSMAYNNRIPGKAGVVVGYEWWKSDKPRTELVHHQ
jgi:hypothetical protein